MHNRTLKNLRSSKQTHLSKSKKSGLIFPVHSILKNLKAINPKTLVREGSAVYLAAVLEYLVAEVLEISGEITAKNKRKRINPRSISLAIQSDAEIHEMLKDVTISEGGGTPFIHEKLLPKNHQSEEMEMVSYKPARPKGKKLLSNNKENVDPWFKKASKLN